MERTSPKTRTEDEVIQATPAPPEATSHKMIETQRHTDKTSNECDDKISQPLDLVKTRQRIQVTPEILDGIENMEATEYQEDKGDGREAKTHNPEISCMRPKVMNPTLLNRNPKERERRRHGSPCGCSVYTTRQ
jgi:hypothetical protein